MSELAGVIFDLDGTLVDTETVAREVLVTALGRLGHTVTDRDVHEIRGRPWSYVRPWLHRRFGISEQAYRAESTPLWDEAFAVGIATFPDTTTVLAGLVDEGIPVGVCTAARRRHLDRVLASVPALTDRFDVSVSATDVSRHKPHPEPYERARELLGTRAECTAAVEDSATGVVAAVRAGLRVVGRHSWPGTDLSAAHLEVGHLKRSDLDEVLDVT